MHCATCDRPLLSTTAASQSHCTQECLRDGGVIREEWTSLPFVEGHVWRVVAKAHHVAPAGVAQHVVHLLGAIGEQERSVRFVSLQPKATRVSAPCGIFLAEH